MKTVAILGAGGWGTALAIILSGNVERIRLWVFEPELCSAMARTRENHLYLPAPLLPRNVSPTTSLEEALHDAEAVIFAVPSQHLRAVCQQAFPFLREGQVLISATKGLELGTLLRMSEVLREIISPKFAPQLAVLSGPTFAREVAQGAPTAVVIASQDTAVANRLQRDFSHSTFRLYTNRDVIGVELGGAMKNVIAIAAGICDSMQLGSNAMAALMTRGLVEITELATACGARRQTMSGLACLGDLVLTCTGIQSRNHSAGVELGRGKTLEQILQSTRMVIEGVQTTEATMQLARKMDVAMPITEQAYAILYEGRSAPDAVRALMERTLKPE